MQRQRRLFTTQVEVLSLVFPGKLGNLHMSKWFIPIKGFAHVYACHDWITLFGIHVNAEMKKFCTCEHGYREVEEKVGHFKSHQKGEEERRPPCGVTEWSVERIK